MISLLKVSSEEREKIQLNTLSFSKSNNTKAFLLSERKCPKQFALDMCHNQYESYVEFTQNPSVTHVTLDQCELALGKNEMVIHTAQTSGRSRISEVPTPKVGGGPIIWSNFPENYMKMKEGVRITGPFPLDPPVQTKFTDSKEENCTGIINTRSGNQTAFGQCNICLNGVFTPSAAETETGTGAETRTLGGGDNKFVSGLCPGIGSGQCENAITKIVAIVKLGSLISN